MTSYSIQKRICNLYVKCMYLKYIYHLNKLNNTICIVAKTQATFNYLDWVSKLKIHTIHTYLKIVCHIPSYFVCRRARYLTSMPWPNTTYTVVLCYHYHLHPIQRSIYRRYRCAGTDEPIETLFGMAALSYQSNEPRLTSTDMYARTQWAHISTYSSEITVSLPQFSTKLSGAVK